MDSKDTNRVIASTKNTRHKERSKETKDIIKIVNSTIKGDDISHFVFKFKLCKDAEIAYREVFKTSNVDYIHLTTILSSQEFIAKMTAVAESDIITAKKVVSPSLLWNMAITTQSEFLTDEEMKRILTQCLRFGVHQFITIKGRIVEVTRPLSPNEICLAINTYKANFPSDGDSNSIGNGNNVTLQINGDFVTPFRSEGELKKHYGVE